VDRGQHRGSSSRTVAELIERWLGWRQQVRPISPVTIANYRGAIDRYILPNLGRAKVQQVDASTIDALYEHMRARGGKCRHCWQRVRRGSPPLRVGERYRPRPGADEVVHKLDCVNGWPLSASAVREVHSVLSGAFKQGAGVGLDRPQPGQASHCALHPLGRGVAARRSRCRPTT
jgi:Phage integrase, N-terminal SAM-like domain